MSDALPIQIIICDDDQAVRDSTKQLVRALANGKRIPAEIREFEDGAPAWSHIGKMDDTTGVILVTDSRMITVDGIELLMGLAGANKLPAYAALNSGQPIEETENLLERSGMKGRVTAISKVGMALSLWLEEFMERAGKDMAGLPYRPAPEIKTAAETAAVLKV